MSKDSSVKHYQNNKEKIPKKSLVKNIIVFLKKQKTESNSRGRNDTEISLKIKKQSLVEYRKRFYENYAKK